MKQLKDVFFLNNDNNYIGVNEKIRWTVWMVIFLTVKFRYVYSLLLPSSSSLLLSNSWRIQHNNPRNCKNHLDQVSSLLVEPSILLQMTNGPNDLNNEEDIPLPQLLNKLNQLGIRYPPDATVEDLRGIYRKAQRSSSSPKNDWLANNDSTVTNVVYRRTKKKKKSSATSTPSRSSSYRSSSNRSRRRPFIRRRTQDGEEEDDDRWLFSSKRQRRYQNYIENDDYDDDEFYYEDLPYILQRKTKKVVQDNTARVKKFFQPINDKVRNRYNRYKSDLDDDGILNVDYWYYDNDINDDTPNPQRSGRSRKTQRSRRRSSSSSYGSETFTNRASSSYSPKQYRTTRKKRKRKKKSYHLSNSSSALNRQPPALPSSSSSVRNNDPYQAAFSKTAFQQNNPSSENNPNSKNENNSKSKIDNNRNSSCSTDTGSKKTERRKRNHDETKKIYSVYPNSKDEEEEKIYQDLEDLYGKTTAQAIDKFGDFIADVISQDDGFSSPSSTKTPSQPTHHKNHTEDNTDNDVKEKRANNKRQKSYWKDRLSERVDYMLGVHEDGNYYKSWQDQMEQQQEGDYVDALDYFNGKIKRKKSKKSRRKQKENELPFWEKDGTLMSLFFGRTPSGQQLTFENFLGVNGSGVNVCTSFFRATFQSSLLVLSYLCRWASCRGALPQPIIVFVLFASAVSAPKRRRLFTVTIAFLTLRTLAEAIHGYIYFDDVDNKHWEEGQRHTLKKSNHNDDDLDDDDKHHSSNKPTDTKSLQNRSDQKIPLNNGETSRRNYSTENQYSTNADDESHKDITSI